MSPRSLEELFTIALDEHDEAALTARRLELLSGPHWDGFQEFPAARRAGRAAEHRWRRVLVSLARVLLRRLPHQGGGTAVRLDLAPLGAGDTEDR